MSKATKKRRNGKAPAKVRATADEPAPPYYVTKEEELELRVKASRGVVMNNIPTSLVIGQPTSFDDYVRQLMIPTRVLELPLVGAGPEDDTRDVFTFVDEKPPHELVKFDTYSDISWRVLRKVLADYAAKIGM
jgi:hypothetical protein